MGIYSAYQMIVKQKLKKLKNCSLVHYLPQKSKGHVHEYKYINKQLMIIIIIILLIAYKYHIVYSVV